MKINIIKTTLRGFGALEIGDGVLLGDLEEAPAGVGGNAVLDDLILQQLAPLVPLHVVREHQNELRLVLAADLKCKVQT